MINDRDAWYGSYAIAKSLGVRFHSKEYESAIYAHFYNWWRSYQSRYRK